MTHESSSDPLQQQLDELTHHWDAEGLEKFLAAYPQLIETINQPKAEDNDAVLVHLLEHAQWVDDLDQVTAVIDVFVAAGADINVRTPRGNGVLHGRLKPKLLSYLRQKGAELDIYAAARHNLMAEAKAFLAQDPTLINRPGPYNQTPLAFSDSVEMAQMLLAQGADLNHRDSTFGSTAVQWAISEPDLGSALAKYFLNQGAEGDIILYAAVGDTARVKAAIEAEPDIVHVEVKDARFTPEPAPWGHLYTHILGETATPLHFASRFNHGETVTTLLAAGAVAEKLAWATPMHVAAWSGCMESLRALVAHNADFGIIDETYMSSPAGWAHHNNQIEARDFILDHARIGLYDATFFGRLARVQELIAADPAQIDGFDGSGIPLRNAAYSGHYEIVKLLLEKGAQPTIPNPDGKTALSWAVEHGHEKVEKLLREAGAE